MGVECFVAVSDIWNPLCSKVVSLKTLRMICFWTSQTKTYGKKPACWKRNLRGMHVYVMRSETWNRLGRTRSLGEIWFSNNLHSFVSGEYGIPRKWYFPFTKSYWLGKSDKRFNSHKYRVSQSEFSDMEVRVSKIIIF